jgi:hypothetical protein
MKENRVFRNIQYDPRIFGLSYKSLFITLFSFMFLLMFMKEVGLLTGFMLSLLFSMGIYSLFYWKDNRDEVDAKANRIRIKNTLTCYEPCDQQIILK